MAVYEVSPSRKQPSASIICWLFKAEQHICDLIYLQRYDFTLAENLDKLDS
jgi:hypothetical protein